MTDIRNYGALRESVEAINIIEKVTRDGKVFAFDIEAGYTGSDKVGVSLMQFHPEYLVTGISFTDGSEWARYIPFAHDNGGNIDDQVAVARALWGLLKTGNGVAHNAAYELKGMSRWFREVLWNDPVLGEEIRSTKGFFPVLADTMLLVWLAGCYHPMRVGKDLKSVSKAAFGIVMTEWDDLFDDKNPDLGPPSTGPKNTRRFNTRNSYSSKIINYACEDSVISLMLYRKFYPDFKKSTVFKFEMALILPLIEMEAGICDETGVFSGNMYFDWTVVQKKDDELVKFIALAGEEIQIELGKRVGRTLNLNLNSAPQLSHILFDPKPDGLGIPVNDRFRSKKTGAPSTSDDALGALAKTDPIIKKILEYRQVVKLHTSYLGKFLKEMRYSGSGYVFPNHNQFGALTGRTSVDQVSYQQWPKTYHFQLDSGLTFDLNFRDLFIAPDEFRIVGFDYANVEMRLAGALSGEPKIIQAFNSGMDLHRSTAAATFKVAFDAVTNKQRQRAKTLNFATLFGSGPQNIADMLTTPDDPVTKEDAEKMLRDYHLGYPVLTDWMNKQKALGRQQHFVTTHFGRKYTLWELEEPYQYQRDKADRMVINAPIQGTAADIMKLAIGRARKAIKDAGLDHLIRMTLTIHDAIEFLVHESISTQFVIDLLEPCVNFRINGIPVEIRADWHEGLQWGAMVDVKVDNKKQIVGYSMEYEMWDRSSSEWEGSSLFEVLDQYYQWEAQQFGVSTPYYSHRRPEFVLVEAPVSTEEKLHVPEPDDEDDPGWFHSPAWHEARNNPVTATVVLVDMPTPDAWDAFQAFLKKHPGFNKVVVETPEGSITLDTTHLLDPSHQPEVSLILGGANLIVASDFVDADEISEGVAF